MRAPAILLIFLATDPASVATEPGAHCTAAETVLLPTADGATVALHHHRGNGPPVLLVHGISSNHWFWDLAPDRSLADALTEAGYDAWLLDLRGHGDAETSADGRRQRSGWSLDDYGRYDVPAAIEHVRRCTGFDRVGFVGHSLGGMVAAIYQAIEGDDSLAALVVVGSPVDFTEPDALLTVGRASMAAGSLVATVPSPFWAGLAAWLPALPFHGDDIFYARGSISADARELMYRHIVSPLSRDELRQFNDILAERAFTSADGTVDYQARLADLDVPLLVIAGGGDRIAPAPRVQAFYDRAGSTDKRYVLADLEHGFDHDYGHLDMGVGDAAADEIYPLVTGWLDGRWSEGDEGR